MALHGGRRTGAGRPKAPRRQVSTRDKTSLRELARAHTKTAIAALAAIAAEGKSEASRVAAATALLDRAYGRPVAANEPMDGNAVAATPSNMPSDLELARAIAFILAKAERASEAG